MNQEAIEFLEANINNWHTAKNGYVRNLDGIVLKKYESIYKEYIQKDFILTAWCSGCVLDMVIRLYRVYETLTKSEPLGKNVELFNEIEKQEVEAYIKKRGRKPKKNEEAH